MDLDEAAVSHRAPTSVVDGAPGAAAGTDAARAQIYLLLANLFAGAPSLSLQQDLGRLEGDDTPLGVSLAGLADVARRVDRSLIEREYFDLFIGVGRGEVLPYASYYLTGFLHDRPLSRVRHDMARLGLERPEGVFEPEDHIASLLEVMAGLTGGGLGHPAAEADLFFKRHIAPWAPRLMGDVMAAPCARFYRSVGELGRTWLEIEQRAIELTS